MLREITKDEADFLAAIKAAPFSAAEMAGPDLSQNIVENLRRGTARLSVPQFRALIRRLRRQDPEAALRLRAALLGDDEEGLVTIPVSVPVSTAEVDREVQEEVAASAMVLEARLRRLPLEEQEARAQAAVREAVEAHQAIRKQVPQLAFGR